MNNQTPPGMENPALGMDLLSFLLENTPDQVYFKDKEGRFLRASKAVADFLAVPNALDLIGRSDFDFWSPETARATRIDEQQIMETGQPLVGKIERLVHPDGRISWDHTTKLPLRNSLGQIIGVCGINKDFTQIKKMENALREERNRLRITTAELAAKNAQLEADLRMAREIQEALLPREYPSGREPGISDPGALSFAHCYRPAAAVGGDFFHFFPLSQHKAGIFICDVMGHGLRAALVTAIIRTCLEELRPSLSDPGQFLRNLNSRLRSILGSVDEPFVATAFYMVADPSAGEVHFANAGHPAPVNLRRSSGIAEKVAESGRRPGCALGLFKEADYRTGHLPFERGDRIVLFTDGLYEVDSPQGDEFGMSSLIDSFRRHADLPANDLFDAVLGDVSRFSLREDFDDDVCLVAVEQPSSNTRSRAFTVTANGIKSSN
ncbi:MAG TPA: SpoIIE family protein phosphatase [Chthoniobacterales bacterium]